MKSCIDNKVLDFQQNLIAAWSGYVAGRIDAKALKGKKTDLAFAVGISLVFTALMKEGWSQGLWGWRWWPPSC